MTLQTMVDEARINQFYEEIEQMVVTLEEDFTYQMFNRKSVLIRTFMDRIGTITSQLTGDLHRVRRYLLKQQKLVEVEQNALLSSDMGVRSERTHAAQLAKVANILRPQVQEINTLLVQKEDLEQMMGLVKLKLQDLHNAQSSLRDQRKAFELIHANGRGLPAMTESVRSMEGDLDTMLAAMRSPVSTLSPVEGFLEDPNTGDGSDGPTPSLESNLDLILNTLPTIDELRKKQRVP